MPLISLATLANLRAAGYAAVRSRWPSRSVSDVSFLGKWANVIAMELFGLQRTAEAIDRDSPPQPKSSTAGLAAWAFTLGLPSNAGGFGANKATPSSGGLAPVTGTGGTVVSIGQQLTAPDGTTIIQLLNGGTIPFTGSFAALTPGVAGNLPAGTKLTWISPPAGCDGFVLLSSPLGGAEPDESPADLLQRELSRWQNPPKGGANVDYVTWATEVEGVFRAYVYPRRQGTGTVDVVILAAGSGAGRLPTEQVRLAVVAFIYSLAPTDVEAINIIVPVQPPERDLTIRLRAQLGTKYSWDWNDTAASYTVAGYSGGTPSLTLNTAAPASLTGAVDLGLEPQLQVVSTNPLDGPIPPMPRVIAYDITKTILTLSAPMTNAPNNGDAVYAGSYAAPRVAQAMLGYVDSLGPSRALPFDADQDDWDDTVAVFNLAQTALDTKDADGFTKLVGKVLVGGVTIAIGAGSPAEADYQSRDSGYTPPELARAAHVVVTQ